MRGIEALEYFLENWHSKIREFDEFVEFEAVVESNSGLQKDVITTSLIIKKFYDRKICILDLDGINEFLPEEVEFDPFSGNLYIKRNLFNLKIAPKIF